MITRIFMLMLGVACGFATGARAADDLAKGFASPPPSARPWVYWYFMDGNLSREGLTADLEAMRDVGIGGAIFLEVDLGLPRGRVKFMSPEWRRLFAHAVHEAERLGIEIALGSGPGWCGTGGPWVRPEQSMQHLVASVTNVFGPILFDGVLARPEPRAPFFGESTLTPELKKQWREFYRDVAVLAFPTPQGDKRLSDIDEKALYKRAPYSSSPGVKSSLPMLSEYPTWSADACIWPEKMIDLTGRMAPNGRLRWEVPPGKWTILRFVRTSTGQITRPAPDPGLGFETDKFSVNAVRAHYEQFVGRLLKEVGPRKKGRGGLTTLHFDSWEMSSQNWSENFRTEFRRRRGYDPLRFLPAYTGRVVGDVETTERFLWDVRRTAQELVIAKHASWLRDRAHRNGWSFSLEPYDMNPSGDLTLGAVADVPMAEFWWKGFDTTYSVIEAASIAHTAGRRIVAAESFTSEPGEDWRAYPGNIKALGDWAFAAGINRLAFHRYQHQPWLDRRPGMQMGPYGVHWERTQTWWSMASAYHTYLARCQFMLRQGRAVADILFLAPEGAPQVFRPPASATVENPPDRRGYNFDGCAPETLLEGASVRNGRIVFPGGTSYGVLVLPELETMTPELLRKVRKLVRGGATVVGPPPKKSPSLKGYPQCDAEVRKLAAELWGESGEPIRCRRCDIELVPTAAPALAGDKKEVSTSYPPYDRLARILREAGVPPDFDADDGPIRYTHRTDGRTDIYFVANRSEQARNVDCTFRVTGRQPELWHPVTGERRTLAVGPAVNGGTTVPLRFEPLESYFVVFREPLTRVSGGENFPPLQEVQEITGPWEVRFEPKWGAPEQVTFTALEDWTKRPEPGVRFYSGQATYCKRFEMAADSLRALAGERLFLDVGVVKNLAAVRLNNQDLGVVWCAPWRVEITQAIKAGTNELQITVANLWVNRLIGDVAAPADQRLTWTSNNPYRADSPLLESGLLGPVTIMRQALP